jgi:microcystin-dependent protein
MTKKYGNYTGTSSEPSNASAPGGWQSPSELNRQILLNKWPRYIPGAAFTAGDYVYAVSSGVVLAAVESDEFLVPSGQEISRTTYADLFNVIGTTFGAGDGSSTFGLPKLNYNHETLLKFTTSSGLSNTVPLGSGVLPSGHTHNVSASSSTAAGNDNTGVFLAFQDTTGIGFTSMEGVQCGNSPRRVYLTPLIATTVSSGPVGSIFHILVPSTTDAYTLIPGNAAVASGQTFNRTDSATLFNRLGTLYGSGDGSTTFSVPDLRGVFIAHPYNNIVLPSGATGSASGFYPDVFAQHRHYFSFVQGFNGANFTGSSTEYGNPVIAPATTSSSAVGVESRPQNVTALLCLVTA